jgi:hypothetical protein
MILWRIWPLLGNGLVNTFLELLSKIGHILLGNGPKSLILSNRRRVFRRVPCWVIIRGHRKEFVVQWIQRRSLSSVGKGSAVGCWRGPRADLESVKKKDTSCSSPEWNSRFLGRSVCTDSYYRLSYPGPVARCDCQLFLSLLCTCSDVLFMFALCIS